MKRPYLALVVALIFVATNAMAGGQVGNGGDVVVCRDSKRIIKSVQLLDFYEAQVLGWGDPYGMGDATTVDDKVELALARLANVRFVNQPMHDIPQRSVAAKRADALRAITRTFRSEALFLRGFVLTDLPDSHHVALREGCQVEQIAVQRPPLVPGDKRYIVNEDLWDHLSQDDRAGLILHEAIYRLAVENNKHRDSVRVRRFNVFVSSRAFETFPDGEEYVDLVSRLGLCHVFLYGDGARDWYDSLPDGKCSDE